MGSHDSLHALCSVVNRRNDADDDADDGVHDYDDDGGDDDDVDVTSETNQCEVNSNPMRNQRQIN